MHKFNGYDIEITRGDSLQFRVSLMGRDLPEGSVGLFTVKASPRDEQALIEKRVDASGELLTITIFLGCRRSRILKMLSFKVVPRTIESSMMTRLSL